MNDAFPSELLDSLTPPQREAVLHVDGPLLILAGPGSGKTRVVTHRIANLLYQGIAPWSILALTFTNKAAEEMRSRVEALAPGQKVWVSTFHRFCARLLRQHASLVGLSENYTIYDTADSGQALKRAMQGMDFDLVHYTPQQIASAISWAKNALITAEAYAPRPGHPLDAVVAKVYPAYQRRLLSSNAVDFDDLLLHIATLLRENPEVRATLDERYRYILVDEYQDTNLAQYAIVRGLSIDFPNLSVTGDPDQSIYGWRGANISNIPNFEQDYPDVHAVRLEQNYRSTKNILAVAGQLIAYNKRRKEKDLFTENDEGAAVRYMAYSTQQSEAESIALQISDLVRNGRRRPRDFAIFYRVNALSRSLEFALRDHGIPYQMVNAVEFYQRKEIKDLLAYLILLNNPRDSEAFMRIVNVPTRGIGKTTLDRLGVHATAQGLSLLDAAREAASVPKVPKKSAGALIAFASMYDRLGQLIHRPVEEVVGSVLTHSGYAEALRQSDTEEDLERLANLEELLTAARQFDERNGGEARLEDFLEEVCLVNDTDAWESETDRVTMMTLHASKGLEFPCVYIIALEEGLIPHERSKERPEQLEEERRLFFVGLTRAEEELQISMARYREFRGQRKMSVPSQFLMELPRDVMQWEEERWPTTSMNIPVPFDDDPFSEAPVWRENWSAPEPVSAPPPVAAKGVSLTTAAEMAGESAPAETVSPDVFVHNMIVRHPEYGLGKIAALSGAGVRRVATVDFASTAGQKKFVLINSPLRPVRSP